MFYGWNWKEVSDPWRCHWNGYGWWSTWSWYVDRMQKKPCKCDHPWSRQMLDLELSIASSPEGDYAMQKKYRVFVFVLRVALLTNPSGFFISRARRVSSSPSYQEDHMWYSDRFENHDLLDARSRSFAHLNRWFSPVLSEQTMLLRTRVDVMACETGWSVTQLPSPKPIFVHAHPKSGNAYPTHGTNSYYGCQQWSRWYGTALFISGNSAPAYSQPETYESQAKMVLTIYGFGPSHCTRRVAVVCKELNVPYDIVTVNLAQGEQKSAEHLARQPFAVVPTIQVSGTFIGIFFIW